MKTKKFLETKASFVMLLMISAMPLPIMGQIAPSYDDVVSDIKALEKLPKKDYNQQTVGGLLGPILDGMIAYESPQNDGTLMTEGLKKRLLSPVSLGEIDKWGLALGDPSTSNLLVLAYVTKQSVVPAFIDDDTLKHDVKGNGLGLVKSEVNFWKKKTVTTNLIEVLEDYPPVTAA